MTEQSERALMEQLADAKDGKIITPKAEAERLVTARILAIEKARATMKECAEILELLGYADAPPEKPKRGRPEGSKNRAPRKTKDAVAS